MTDTRQKVLAQIGELLDSQRLAVLSTHKGNQPYSSLVAFSASFDSTYIYLLTPSTTRKYENLTANPKVSILVNDSRNRPDDIYNAVSVTGTGVAEVIEKSENMDVLNRYLKKHPQLKEFSNAPTSAFIRIAIQRYFMVNRFQNVVEVKVIP